MKTRLCAKCGNQNQEDAWSCINCGETLAVNTITEVESAAGPQEKDEITSVICQNCHSVSPTSSMYCSNCGVKLDGPPNLGEIAHTDQSENIENTSQMQISIFRKFNESIIEFQENQYQLMNTISDLRNSIEHTRRDHSSSVYVDNFNMPFLSIVFFLVKFVLASIPAMIILVIIFAISTAIFEGALFSIIWGLIKSNAPQVLP